MGTRKQVSPVQQDSGPDELQNALEQVELDLDLVAPDLVQWNRRYFKRQRRRYASDLSLVERYVTTGEILEIGSLPCHMTSCLQQLGHCVVGLDLDPSRAAPFIAKHKLAVEQCDIEREPIPFVDGRFDLILLCEVFEHLRIDPISTLREINRVLTPDGSLILTTPNLYSARTIYRFLRGRGIGDAYKEFGQLHRVGHMGHVREYSTVELTDFLRGTGFRIVEVEYRGKGGGGGKIDRLLDVCARLIPKWRPYQVLICRKASLRVVDGEAV